MARSLFWLANGFYGFTIKEPQRGRYDAPNQQKSTTTSITAVTKQLLSYKTFIFLAFACALNAFGSYGVGNFTPPFLYRVHGLDVATIGTWLSLTTGFGGGIGVFLGGYLADKMGRKDIRWYLWIPLIAGLIKFLPSTIVLFSENTRLVLGTTFFSNLLTPLYLGPALAVTHNLVAADNRAFASSILFFILNLIGLGMGPMVVGMLSDWFTPTYGELALRWAFCIIYFTGPLSLFLFYKASQHYEADLMRSRR